MSLHEANIVECPAVDPEGRMCDGLDQDDDVVSLQVDFDAMEVLSIYGRPALRPCDRQLGVPVGFNDVGTNAQIGATTSQAVDTGGIGVIDRSMLVTKSRHHTNSRWNTCATSGCLCLYIWDAIST